jgi:phthiocerol/phenolphthiocerol synthesis type-I polyketide synthase B
LSTSDPRAIAVIGIGCRFPGGADSWSSFWQMLCDGVDAIGDIPADRFDLARFQDAKPQTPGKTVARHGGYLDRIDEFDAAFFKISPREAASVDPQQRLILETAWEALEDAGADVNALRGARVGVYVGQWLSDFEQRIFTHPDEVDFPATLGSGRYAASGRIAYAFGFRGPTLTLDTACSSSLYAVHLAVQGLRSGETSLALAAAANVILAPHIHVAYSQSGMMAPDGRCKFGDAAANGYVRSEGAAVLALKRLDDAVRDGDRIHAVIRGSAVNNDGSTSGSMGTPSRDGQRELVQAALADARVAPASIGYVEAHGTGTRAGDPVEIGALSDALGAGRAADKPLLVGSVKTNIGHTESVAGLAGLIKAICAVRTGFIPRSLHYNEPSALIPWADLPVAIASKGGDWPHEGPRLASVSAFGIAGANGHIIVEAPPVQERVAPKSATLPLLLLSARSEEALRARALQIAETISSENLLELIRFSQSRLTALEYRAVFLANDAAELRAALTAFAAGGDALASGAADPHRPPQLAAVCPGQGGQWIGMARELMAAEPAFLSLIERADQVIRAETDWSLLEQLKLNDKDPAHVGQRIDVVQPMLTAVSLAYAEWLGAHGVQFDAVVGHSMGEAAAAHIAGAISLDDALRIVCRRSRLMREKSGEGGMALVDLPRAEVETSLAGLEQRVSVAAVNSPRACIISGDKAVVAELVERFSARGVFSRLVNVDVASHSPHMAEPARELALGLADLKPKATDIAFASAVLGRAAEGEELNAAYWARNLREPVLFADALGVLSERGATAFIELGPHPTLTPAMEQTLGDRAGAIVCCGRREENERNTLLAALAKLWCVGVRVKWRGADAASAPMIRFPSYPWQRERHWISSADLQTGRGEGGVSWRALTEEARSWLHAVEWRAIVSQPPASVRGVRWLVIGEAPTMCSALRAEGASVEQASFDDLQRMLAGLGSDALNILIAAPVSGGAYAPVQAARALPKGVQARLWFLTHHAQSPQGDARTDMDQAACWGSARVLSDERPEIWGGLVDLAAHGDARDAAAAAAFLLAPGEEDQVSVRRGIIYAPRIVAAPNPKGERIRWRSDGAYLITGGFGDVGLAVARAMVEEGARRLILVGRTALPPRSEWARLDETSVLGRRVAAVRALERLGAAIHCVELDVANEAAVAAFLQSYESEGWPRISGVLHLAAVLDRRLIEETWAADFSAAVKAKLEGARILDRLLPDLDCFILFSSLSTFLPQAGMASYVAANMALEALALDRRARGVPASCIAWGAWRGAGVIGDDRGAANIAEMAQRGFGSFDPAEGAALVSWAAGREAPWLAVTPMDWGAYAQARAGRNEPLLRELKIDRSGDTLADRLNAAEPAERRALLAGVVAEAVAKTLHLPVAGVGQAREFGEMGLTSILAMELRNRLERALARPLSATLAWNYPTVAKLSAHLAGEPSQAPVERNARAAEESRPDPRLANVAELTEADALAALRRRKGGAA